MRPNKTYLSHAAYDRAYANHHLTYNFLPKLKARMDADTETRSKYNVLRP